jgi:transporter family-2 protein
MQAPVALLLAVIAGVLIAVQAPTNAMLGKALAAPMGAALISFLVGSAALLAVALAVSPRPSVAGLRDLPWYAWVGGFYGAFFVAVATFTAPRLGIGVLLTAAIAGQLAAALVLDHFGMLGLDRHPINLARLLGLGLVVAGAVLVRRS